MFYSYGGKQSIQIIVPLEIGYVFADMFSAENATSLDSFEEMQNIMHVKTKASAEELYKRTEEYPTGLDRFRIYLHKDTHIFFEFNQGIVPFTFPLPKVFVKDKKTAKRTKRQITDMSVKYQWNMEHQLPDRLGNNLSIMTSKNPNSFVISDQVVQNLETSLIALEPNLQSAMVTYDQNNSVISCGKATFQWAVEIMKVIAEQNEKIMELHEHQIKLEENQVKIEKKIEKLEQVRIVKKNKIQKRARFGGIYARRNKSGALIGYRIKYPSSASNYQFSYKYVSKHTIQENEEIPIDAQKLTAIAKQLGLKDHVIIRCIRKLNL